MTTTMTTADYQRRGMSEAAFQQQVIGMAHLFGWRAAHFRAVRVQRRDGSVRHMTPVQADGAGWPDLVLVHPERGIMFVELKTATGTLREEQRVWRVALLLAGGDYRVWRPGDAEGIEAALRG